MELTPIQAVHLAGLPFPAARAFLQQSAMSLHDRERRAYIEGRTCEAELLGMAADAEDGFANREREDSEEIEKLEAENDRLTSELDDAKAEAESFKDDLTAANNHAAELQREFDNLSERFHVMGLDLV